MNEETLTGRPDDTSIQKPTSDNENDDAVQRHAQDVLIITLRLGNELLLSVIPACITGQSKFLQYDGDQ